MPENRDKNWLRHLYRQSPVAIGIYIGKEFIIEFANQKMCGFLGRREEQILNMPLFEAVPEVRNQGFEEILENVFRTGAPYTGLEIPAAISQNGVLSLNYYNILYEALRDEQGEIYGICETSIDVSETVKARLEAERDSEIFRFALEAGKIGTWHYNVVEKSYITSLAHDQVFGTKEKFTEWDTDIFCQYILPEDLPMVLEVVTEGYKTGGFSFEARIQWKDKSIHWIKSVGKVKFNLAHNPISLSGIIMDITDQKLAIERDRQIDKEHAARLEAEKQQKTLYELFMKAPAIICVLRGPDLIFELVNPPAQETIFSGRDIIGLPIQEAFPQMKGKINPLILKSIYATGKSYHGNEIEIELVKDGELTTFWFDFVFQPFFDSDGIISGIVVFAFDLTEQIIARKKLREVMLVLEDQNRQLTRTNKDLDNFIYTASHDLRAPISNLEGLLATYFSEVEVPEDKKTMVNMMFDSIDRFKITIEDLTEIINVQKDISEDHQMLCFATIIEDVRQNVKSLIHEKKAIIHTDFQIENIAYSRKNLRSVLYNLISNGIKYSSPNRRPEIRVATYKENNCLVLSVIDNGLGIHEANKDKVFGMFKRLHNHVDGSGIGLYIVKRIVENAGGQIELNSELDKGTEFKIYFEKEHNKILIDH